MEGKGSGMYVCICVICNDMQWGPEGRALERERYSFKEKKKKKEKEASQKSNQKVQSLFDKIIISK